MESAQKNPSVAALEVVLFVYGEPISRAKLAQTLSCEPDVLEGLITQYKEQLSGDERGLVLMEKGDALMLATKPAFAHILENFVKESLKEDLTPAALETLSLVAYFGPVSRAQLDYIRGVNSTFMLRNLLMRNLVERKSGKGNAYEYGITQDFLKHMGLSRVEEMPEYQKYQELKATYFSEEQSL